MRKIHVIVDYSGSFSVKGKKSALRYILGAILRQIHWQGGNFALYLWQDDIMPVNEDDWGMEKPGGNADIEVLSDFLHNVPADDGIVILTDGLWDDAEDFEDLVEGMEAEIVFVAIGADADMSQLEDIAETFAAEDVVMAIRYLLGEVCHEL